MKRFFTLALAAFMTLTAVDAQAQHIQKQRVGSYYDGDNIVFAEARTTLAVDVTVEHEVFVVGPYARYAQRLLGTRASLVGRDEYHIVSSEVMLTDSDHHYESRTMVSAQDEAVAEFGYPLIDKLSSVDVELEAAAEAAAKQIYALRRARLDLITGELGDGSFGAGVTSALEEIERLEREYLDLFYGKRSVITSSHRYIVPIEEDKSTYLIARFNREEGLVDEDDLSGDIILVTIRPSQMSYPAGDPKGKIAYRYANNANVMLSLGGNPLTERVLPIYECGCTVLFPSPVK